MLALVGLAELLGMTPWFSASAVSSSIVAEYHLSSAQAAWLTMAVQGGFVAGTLVAALFNLSDLVSARWVFGIGCLGAAAANALVTTAPSPVEAVAWRFATGTALALVYPPGMKIVAGWFSARRGAALGVLVASLTLGKAVAVSARGRLGRRLAVDDADGVGPGGSRRPGRRSGRQGRPPGDARSRLRSPCRDPRLHAPRHPARRAGLPRAHVGAVRHVDLGGRLRDGRAGRPRHSLGRASRFAGGVRGDWRGGGRVLLRPGSSPTGAAARTWRRGP